MTVGEHFRPPTRFIFAYEYSPTCVKMMKRIAESDLLRQLQCHLLYIGDHVEILNEPLQYLTEAGLEVVPEYRYGEVAENILSYQQEHGIQLIVLGHSVTARSTSSSWAVLRQRFSAILKFHYW